MPGRISYFRSTEGLGISSRIKSNTSGLAWPSRIMLTCTCVPLGPFSALATWSEVMPSALLPSTAAMMSPGWIPARNEGVFS
jgi:hypothetical protein